MKNITVIHPNGKISAQQARQLLQRFRDLNLGPCGIEVTDRGRILVQGCLSLDHPVETGVRYALKGDDGERVLSIHWTKGRLLLELSASESAAAGQLEVPLACDGLGRVAAPELGARLHLEDSDARDIEHFLRRIVRAVYSKAS